jgi:acetyl-CoA carboxylase/biotin carboxylase 1
VWGYFSVAASGGLHEFADSQFGHCFSWGETRDDARENLVVALKELSIRGDFRTTVEYLVTLLEKEDFQQNRFDTNWLDVLIAERVKPGKPNTFLAIVCAALHIVEQTIANAFSQFQASLERFVFTKSQKQVSPNSFCKVFPAPKTKSLVLGMKNTILWPLKILQTLTFDF